MNFFQRSKLKSLRKKVQGIHAQREHNSNNANIQGEIKLQYELAQFYDKHRFDSGLPQAEIYALECYRAAAALGDMKAHYICGQRLLDQAKFWDAWSRTPLYGAAIHKKYAAACYEEAFAYLETADLSDYVLAKRLLGLVYIHGWGKPKDLDAGYKRILDSIELEKSWDKATKIFEELKLNSPEFFAALQSHKRN
jgi:TPR repeat protein